MNMISERHAHHPVNAWIESTTDSVQPFVVPSAPSVVSMITGIDVFSHLSSASFVDDDDIDNDGNESKLNGSIQGERRVLFEGYWNAARGESWTYYTAPNDEAAFLDWIGERDGNEDNLLSAPDMPTCNEHSTRENYRRKIFHFATLDSSSPVPLSPRTTRNLPKSLERPAATRARSISDSSCSFSQRSCLRSSRFAPGIGRRESSISSMSQCPVYFNSEHNLIFEIVELIKSLIPETRLK
jgi:hypothetical protein